MATFTMPLHQVVDIRGGSSQIVDGYRQVSGVDLGLDHYPIFDEEHRPLLNSLIVDHYWNREIGMESVDMFTHAMRRRMNEIMPPYNLLFKSTQIEFDPLSTMDIRSVMSGNATNERDSKAKSTGETTGESTGVNKAEASSNSRSSQFPQTGIALEGEYATEGAVSQSTSDSTSNEQQQGSQTSESTDEDRSRGSQSSDSRTSGYQGLPSDMLMRYRDSIINVNMMIVNDLADLFMGIWDIGDPYTNRQDWGYYA